MSVAPDGDAAPCGLLELDHDGTVSAANRVVLGWIGRTAADVVGRVRFADLLSVGGRIYWETHLVSRLELAGAVEEVTVELRGPSGRVPVMLSAARGTDDGRVRVALQAAAERVRFERDLRTAREQAHRAVTRLATLQAVTAGLARALGVRGVADALLGAATGALGAPAATLWTTVDGGLHLHSSRGEDSPPTPDAARSADRVPWSADGRLQIPLHSTSALQGVLSLADRGRAAPAPDADVLTAVGQQAGLALDRARLYEQSADVAHALQHAMLVVDPPVDPRYDMGATYRAGVEMLEVGGDWYDLFLVGPDVLGVVVGDVVGRGLVAASAMGQLRSAVRAVAEPGGGPARVLTRLDRFVDQLPTAQMATVAYAELDLRGGVLRYACAGHPPPLLLPDDGLDHYLWAGRSTPLGVVRDDQPRGEARVRLDPGDRVLLYTDGLVERRDRDLDDGMAGLATTVRRVREQPLREATDTITAAMLDGEVGSDDVCTLLMSWGGSGG